MEIKKNTIIDFKKYLIYFLLYFLYLHGNNIHMIRSKSTKKLILLCKKRAIKKVSL